MQEEPLLGEEGARQQTHGLDLISDSSAGGAAPASANSHVFPLPLLLRHLPPRVVADEDQSALPLPPPARSLEAQATLASAAAHIGGAAAVSTFWLDKLPDGSAIWAALRSELKQASCLRHAAAACRALPLLKGQSLQFCRQRLPAGNPPA